MTEEQILCWYGSDPFEAGKNLMEASAVWKYWGATEHIGLKPNLVVSKDASSGATTHPEFCAGIITFLREQGFSNISILEGSWVGDRTERAFKVCGYSDLSQKYSIPLVDLQKDSSISCEATNGDYRICESILNLDRLINLPVLKGHCQTAMTCAMKNLKGCIPDSEKRRYHSEGLFQPIADLNEILKADLILVDALQGDPDFEEGGNPQTMNLFMAALDPVLVDSYACTLLGLSIEDVPYIKKGETLGAGISYVGSDTLLPLNKGEGFRSLQQSSLSRKLAGHVHEKGACSACYASLMQALKVLGEEGGTLPETVKIGQGFKGLQCEGIGIGLCLDGCASNVPGCPPSSSEITDFLKKRL